MTETEAEQLTERMMKLAREDKFIAAAWALFETSVAPRFDTKDLTELKITFYTGAFAALEFAIHSRVPGAGHLAYNETKSFKDDIVEHLMKDKKP